ncbi:MAG: HAD-IIB family hydrolase [Paracoccaceae bacterium]
MTREPTYQPKTGTRAVVFTDLDGTLLDHETYAWAAAIPALDALKARGVPLVLASSKTAAEIAPLHAALGLGDAPAIVENGAGIWRPGAEAREDGAYRRLRTALEALPKELRVHFRGFGDMSAFEVAEITGLSREAAALARTRRYSEPGTWSGDAATLERFLGALEAQGIAARRGGRFLTLSLGATKADRMEEIAAALGATTTLALGDAPNDIEMLEAASAGVIVKNDHGTPLTRLMGEDAGRITRTEAPGPAGWNQAVLDWLGMADID